MQAASGKHVRYNLGALPPLGKRYRPVDNRPVLPRQSSGMRGGLHGASSLVQRIPETSSSKRPLVP